MAGAVLENLSTKKLSAFCLVLLLAQIVCFLIGGLVAPAPSSAFPILATKCIDPAHNLKAWFLPWGDKGCDKVRDFAEAARKGVYADWIVFAAHIPHRPFTMERWFQYLLGVLVMDIAYSDLPGKGMDPNANVTLVMRLGYRDDMESEFKELINATETRKLQCILPQENSGYHYQCEPIPLFELGSVHHKYYLLNIRMPVSRDKDTGALTNTNIGSPEDVTVVAIHQNGGFTKVWISLKTFMFPIVVLVTVWFWRRVLTLGRPPVLLERSILSLAIIMSILNFPMEWITVWVNVPFMTLLGDLKQGAFYAMLFSFWIIFIGEHLMDQTQRNRLRVYWQQVATIVFTFFCLFVLDMCERGVQLANPFFSMWNTNKGANLALTFIALAGICLCCYCLFLLFMVYQVFRNISMRRITLHSMPKARRLHYGVCLALTVLIAWVWPSPLLNCPHRWFGTLKRSLPGIPDEFTRNSLKELIVMGLIFRFRFFMVFTCLIAILTVIFFITSQVLDGHQKVGERKPSVHYTSAFYTGVYGMWNIYVTAVLVLYAPSHKDKASAANGDTSEGSRVEFEIDTTTAESTNNPATAGARAESFHLLSKVATE